MERNALTMLVARNIKSIMDDKGLTPAEVARRVGSNPTIVYDILSGKSRNPRLDTLHKIAVKGLAVSVSALLYESRSTELSQELVDAFAAMPNEDQKRFLLMAQAFAAIPSSA